MGLRTSGLLAQKLGDVTDEQNASIHTDSLPSLDIRMAGAVVLQLPFVCPSWRSFQVAVCMPLVNDTVQLLC